MFFDSSIPTQRSKKKKKLLNDKSLLGTWEDKNGSMGAVTATVNRHISTSLSALLITFILNSLSNTLIKISAGDQFLHCVESHIAVTFGDILSNMTANLLNLLTA